MSVFLLFVATIFADGVIEPVKRNYSKRSEIYFTVGLILHFVFLNRALETMPNITRFKNFFKNITILHFSSVDDVIDLMLLHKSNRCLLWFVYFLFVLCQSIGILRLIICFFFLPLVGLFIVNCIAFVFEFTDWSVAVQITLNLSPLYYEINR